MGQGKVKPRSNGVKPTGGLTPARPDAAAGFGNRPQGIISSAVSCIQTHAVAHVERWWWPEPTTASSKAAAGVRVVAGSMLKLASEPTDALGLLYGVLRAWWSRRGDQMVTGAALTASSAGGVLRAARGRRLRRARGSGVRGVRCRCSQRVQGARGRGRGRPVAPESAAMSFGGR